MPKAATSTFIRSKGLSKVSILYGFSILLKVVWPSNVVIRKSYDPAISIDKKNLPKKRKEAHIEAICLGEAYTDDADNIFGDFRTDLNQVNKQKGLL